MQQSTSCESAQAGTGAINAPIANTTARTFRNRNMEGSWTIQSAKSILPGTENLAPGFYAAGNLLPVISVKTFST